MDRNHKLSEEEKERVQELLETIALNPRAFRAALGLQTDQDIRDEEAYQDRFQAWRHAAIERLKAQR